MPSAQTQLKEQIEESNKLTTKMLDDLEPRIKALEKGDVDVEGKSASDLMQEVKKRADDNAEAVDAIKELTKEFREEQQERQDEFEAKFTGGLSAGKAGSNMKTLVGKALEESGLTPDTKGRASFEVDLGRFERGSGRKAITNLAESAGGLLIPEYDEELITLGREMPRVRDLLNSRTTTSQSIVYFRHASTTGAAATQAAQLDLKPEADLAFEQMVANVSTIAVWTYVARQMLDDVSYLRGVVEGELRYLVEIEEDRQLLKGDGTNGDMNGLKDVATAYDATLDEAAGVDPAGIQNLDVLRLALLQVNLTFFPPTGMILHPTDATGLELLKDGDGGYLFANPMNGNALRPWGFPAAQTTQQTAGEFTVGAFNMVDYWQREAVGVEVSTEDGDNFRRNRATMLAEKRAAIAAKRPQTIVDGSFETAKTNV